MRLRGYECYDCGHRELLPDLRWRAAKRWVRRFCLWDARWVARPARPAGEAVFNYSQIINVAPVIRPMSRSPSQFLTLMNEIGTKIAHDPLAVAWLEDEAMPTVVPLYRHPPIRLDIAWDWPAAPAVAA